MPHLTDLLTGLADPAAYPFPVDQVAVRQTHISAVFLAGDRVYKVKKPVVFPFLDFGTPERRRHFCEEEVRLNRRLAPQVYRGVVPITQDAAGRLAVAGDGTPVEWAVEMVRLPEEATLQARLGRGAVTADQVALLAGRLAGFHAAAARGDYIAGFARFDGVARNVRDNLGQAAADRGVTLSAAVHARLTALTEAALAWLRPLMEARAAGGIPRETHGDLHLDHVYLFPDRPPPGDVVIVDCIEFNERFRFADPVADMAFLAMDLAFHGRRDLAEAFAAAYFRATGDDAGRDLLPLYVSYRAAVRGRVEGLELAEAEIPAEAKAAATVRARAHWQLALAELAPLGERPALVLIAGLPGTGKSTLARQLAGRAGFTVLRTDAVRKELAAGVDEDIYTHAWTERTYAECMRRAEGLIFEGGRVIVDATFREEGRRQAFLDAARRWGVPGVLLLGETDAKTALHRLAGRSGDVSDADAAVYRQLAARWEPLGPATAAAAARLDAGQTPDAVLAAAVAVLMDCGLLEGPLTQSPSSGAPAPAAPGR